MTSLILDYSRENSVTLVKAAFENTQGIKQYHDDGHRIVGKSGMGIASYGEKVIVEIPENQGRDGGTMIYVTAEKEVSTNITANPDLFKSRFLEELDTLRGHKVNDILDTMSQNMEPKDSKEVSKSEHLRDGSEGMGVVMIITIILGFLFMFMMMAAVSP